uniref:Putative secreted protein n=1 Tax=Panstrongylus lignarius TaxID=156445 RepID=A0A224XU58_9HEMI
MILLINHCSFSIIFMLADKFQQLRCIFCDGVYTFSWIQPMYFVSSSIFTVVWFNRNDFHCFKIPSDITLND